MRSYRLATLLALPFLSLWLFWRQIRGKEDRARLRERFGFASVPRPPGTLLWLHAASVGEANSIVPLMLQIRERYPHIRQLLTTGTVTSAQAMSKRLPDDIIHQYVPIDTPGAIDRFIWHWRPEFSFWVESEFWPNLITAASQLPSFMGVINARMSERSFRSWQKHPAMIKHLLSRFHIVFAQSDKDAERLKTLGATLVQCPGNIKYDAALLACNEDALLSLKKTVGARPLWLAASTHPGEEALIAQTHRLLAATRPNLLTVIVPRHPERGASIAAELASDRVALRSKQQQLASGTEFYIADTLGELGLFYRLCDIVFMGGSLVAHGGQNPLEPARLACAILTGPHTQNFADIYRDMEQSQVCLRVDNVPTLAAQLDRLLNDAKSKEALQHAVRQWIKPRGGATSRILEALDPVLSFQPLRKAG